MGLHDFFRHPAISIPRKLLVHSQIVLTILLYGAESQMYLQSHLTKLNKLHYKVLRQNLQSQELLLPQGARALTD